MPLKTLFAACVAVAVSSLPGSGVAASETCKDLAPAEIARVLGIDLERKNRRFSSPNVIVILADDLTYSRLSTYGGEIPVPNIDRLARDGARFTDGYSASPVCSPARAALMTGKWPATIPHFFNVYDQHREGLPLKEKTMAERFSELGYATGMVGKWHLGLGEGYQPHERGFDEYFAASSVGVGSAASIESVANKPFFRSSSFIAKVKSCLENPEYLLDVEGVAASSFVLRNRNVPFFLYLSTHATHGSFKVALEPFFKRLSYWLKPSYAGNIFNKVKRRYYKKVHHLDITVGRVLDTIDFLGLSENTLIWFLGDNGGSRRKVSGYSQSPLREAKGTFYEGGIRVPFLVRWTGTVSPGVYEWPVHSVDILPTSLAAAGETFLQTNEDPSVTSLNILPYLKSGDSPSPRYLYWAHRHIAYKELPRIFLTASVVRFGDWKLLERSLRGHTLSRELYNLRDDVGEKNNLVGSSDFFDVLLDLSSKLDALTKLTFD